MDVPMNGANQSGYSELVTNPIGSALHNSNNDILPFNNSFSVNNNLSFQDVPSAPVEKNSQTLQSTLVCNDGFHTEMNSNNPLSTGITTETNSSDPDNCSDADTFKFALCSIDKDADYNFDSSPSKENISNDSKDREKVDLSDAAKEKEDYFPVCETISSANNNESYQPSLPPLNSSFTKCTDILPSAERDFVGDSNDMKESLDEELYKEPLKYVPGESFPPSFNFDNKSIYKTSGLGQMNVHIGKRDSFQNASEYSSNESNQLKMHTERTALQETPKFISNQLFEQTPDTSNQPICENNETCTSLNKISFNDKDPVSTFSKKECKETKCNDTSENLIGKSYESYVVPKESLLTSLSTNASKSSDNYTSDQEKSLYQMKKDYSFDYHSSIMDSCIAKDSGIDSPNKQCNTRSSENFADISKPNKVFPSYESGNACKFSSSNYIPSPLNVVDYFSCSALNEPKEILNTTEKITQNPLEKLNQHLNSIGCNDVKEHESETSVNSFNLDNSDSNKREIVTQAKINEVDSNQSEDAASSIDADAFKENTGFPSVFSGLVTIGKYIPVTGDFTLRSSEALIESPSLIAPYLLKEPDSFPPKLGDSKSEPRDFFYSAAGELLMGIGLSQVTEWYHRDMIRSKKRHIKKDGNIPQLEEELKLHEKCYIEAKRANSIYSFRRKYCEICGFSSESSIVMEGHLLIPHLTYRKEFQCNFCDFCHRDPKSVLDHMIVAHKKPGRLQPPMSLFYCPYCTFETNSKVKINTHLAKCHRFFDPARNQLPPKDFEFPTLTPKPITVAVVKAYEKSLNSMQRGRGRPRKVDVLAEQMNFNHLNSITQSHNINNASVVPHPILPYRPPSVSVSEHLPVMSNPMVSHLSLPSLNLRSPHSNTMNHLRAPLPPMHLPPSNRFFQVNTSSQIIPMLSNNNPMVTSTSQFHFNPSLVNSCTKKVPSPTPFFSTAFNNSLRPQNPSKNVPEVSLPKLQGPYQVPVNKTVTSSPNNPMSSNNLIVCEICDGYIKDLEQLRSHMMLIHKVKIHPKMLVSRPPLNCQKCHWRFFTDQGLERHLLGTHGLVTSNMQELANRNKDAGCCTICGRVYASKLVSHMNQVHKITLKPAHLSYKCTVCSATFNLYRLFENHVYLVHSGAAKRSSDDSSSRSKKIRSLMEQ